MKIEADAASIDKAKCGDLAALESVLRQVQPGVFNLAIRMLGNREDAQDATQEILLKITTHLSEWRGQSAFGTWAYSVASNHLLNALQRNPRRREVSFEQMEEALGEGLAINRMQPINERILTPEEKLEARRTALSCTQAMLMCLDANGRLAYVLDVVFGLDAPQAAAVQGISDAAHRQRLSRSRSRLHEFMGQQCGLVHDSASCHCPRQLQAKRKLALSGHKQSGLTVSNEELSRTSQALSELIAMGDAAAVIRGSPQYAASEAMWQAIRFVVTQSPTLRQ
jgi:RNA polymerase sigma factor (sigma-70 family)